MRLFTFGFAGGSASSFLGLERCIGPEIELIKMEYPGHGTRMKAPLCTDFSELTAELYHKVRECCRDGEPYALLGYSMGCVAAVEMLRSIIDRGEFGAPQHIFLAAHMPRTIKELSGLASQDADQFIMNRTAHYGGVPPNLMNSRTFWQVYLPIYRADYTMLWRYDFDRVDLQTTIPATFFYSEADTPFSEMLKWKRYFKGETDFVRYDGNHFFLYEYCQEMADEICRRCLK